MSIKDRLIQFVFRGKDDLSPEARKIAEALEKVRKEGESVREELDRAKDAQGLAIAFRTTSEAAERAQATLDRTEKRVEDLRSELDRAPDSKGLATSLREAEREASKAARELDKLTVATKQAEEAARGAGIDTRNLADEERRLSGEVEKSRRASEDNSRQLRDLERQQRAAARATQEHRSRVDAARASMASAGKTIIAYAAAYVSLSGAMRLVRRGYDLLREGVRSVIAESSNQEQSLAQLQAALEATGSAAGFTADELLRMADELERNSLFTGEQIVDAQTRLLSYTDIVGEQFPKALQIAIDQAQRLGISVESSAETVGKALQSPSRAMEALGRQGFKLEAGQDRLLKRLEATGKMAEAQAIIMDMLTESYGGAAAAARVGTIEGLWKNLTDRLGEFYKMVGNAGMIDYLKGRLEAVGDYIAEMATDGRLQRLAEALSNAFIQGAEKVQEFIVKLGNIDFNTLTDDASTWLNDFGNKLEDAMLRIQLFLAPFRTLFNGLTAGVSTVGAAVTGLWGLVLRGIEEIAERIPDIFGGEKIHAGVKSAREALDALRDGFVDQIEQDGRDIRNAWDTTWAYANKANKGIKDAAAEASADTVDQWDAAVNEVVAKQEELAQQLLQTFLAGTNQIQSMAEALSLIDTAKTIEQYKGLREALLAAYQDGKLSQEEFAQSLNLLAEGIQELGGESEQTARRLEDVINALGDFNDVQRAIKDAKTDVDISKLRSAITKLYEDGALTAKEYNKAVKELEQQQAKLKESTDDQAGSQDQLTKSLDEATRAMLDQAEAAKKAQEEETKASQQRRANWSDFFGGVLTEARSSLANLSEAALSAFDSMKQINNTDLSFDLSSVKGIEDAIKQVNGQLGELHRNLADGFRQSNPFARFADETLLASNQLQKSYLEQKLQLEQLMASYENGSISLSSFRSAAHGLKATLDLLDASDLSRLDSALASVKQRMDGLAQSTKSTLESLQDELDRLQGREDEIERRRMANRRADLQMQLAEARASGDNRSIQNLQQAISMLTRIESESAFAREQAEREKRREVQAAAAPGAPAAPAQTQPTTVIRLESQGGAVDVAVPDGQEAALLSILEQAGLRTIN